MQRRDKMIEGRSRDMEEKRSKIGEGKGGVGEEGRRVGRNKEGI